MSYSSLLNVKQFALNLRNVFILSQDFKRALMQSNQQDYSFATLSKEYIEPRTTAANLLCYYKRLVMPVRIGLSNHSEKCWTYVEADFLNSTVRGPEPYLSKFQ